MQEKTCMIPISSNHLTVLTFCLFRSAMADSVYKNGLMAELIGRTRTAIQAYTSADMSARSVSARIPVIKHHECIWIKLRKYLDCYMRTKKLQTSQRISAAWSLSFYSLQDNQQNTRFTLKSEYDQEITQLHTADQPKAH